MKSLTDIKQSKNLMEILPPESADFIMYYNKEDRSYVITDYPDDAMSGEDDIPCWSLSALLDVIPFCSLRRLMDGNWIVAAEFSFNGYIESLPNKSAVNACVEMIITLHKQKGGEK